MNEDRLAAARDLVEHVLERFHEVHRRELPQIVALARDVEAGGGPAGFAAPFAALAEALEVHMFKEEMRLFPMMEQGGNSLIVQLIDDMQAEHRLHGEEVAHLDAVLQALPAAARCWPRCARPGPSSWPTWRSTRGSRTSGCS